jgi:hypothetical protein
MPTIFSVIDTTDGGDSGYEGFVKDAANWAVAETALSAATTHILVGGGAGVMPVFTASTGTGSPVRATSPTLVTPTIASFANANHDHSTAAGGGAISSWFQTSGTFAATPASTSTLTMTTDMTASIKAGMSLKYVIGGVTKYGRVSDCAANLLTVNGAPMGGDVTALYYGGGTIRQVTVIIPDSYEDASNTALITSDLKSALVWSLPISYCVAFSVYSNTHDSGTHGQASVRINNAELCTTAGGLTVAAATTWYNTVVDIDVAAYDINPGEAIEVTAVKAGTGDAANLTVKMIFVTP